MAPQGATVDPEPLGALGQLAQLDLGVTLDHPVDQGTGETQDHQDVQDTHMVEERERQEWTGTMELQEPREPGELDIQDAMAWTAHPGAGELQEDQDA